MRTSGRTRGNIFFDNPDSFEQCVSKANDLHERGELYVTEAAVVNDEVEEELEPDGVEEDVFLRRQ